MDFTYFNAVYTVEKCPFKKSGMKKGMKRWRNFFETGHCPECKGNPLKPAGPRHTVAALIFLPPVP